MRTRSAFCFVILFLCLAVARGFSAAVADVEPGAPAPAAGSGARLAAPLSLPQPAPVDRDLRPTLEASLPQLPLYFIENQGQLDEQVAYYVQGRDKTLYFTPQGVTFVLSTATGAEPAGAPQRWVIKLDFVGANPHVQPVGEDETGAVISYFRGRPEEWKTGLKTYSKVVYRDLWPGIDLQYSGTVNRLKYQFIVHPGADPSQIRLAYRGATQVALDESGRLLVSTPVGSFYDDAPYAYQEAGGEPVPVKVSYQLSAAPHEPGVYGFDVGAYDRGKPLVLDPAVIVYCGFIGGSGQDEAYGVAVDSAGNAYVTGATYTGAATFPETVGPDLGHNGGRDAFVAKVRASGSSLAYCGYIGGSEWDQGNDIAVDSSGCAYVTGETRSSELEGFPLNVGPALTHEGLKDAFVAKVNAAGTSLDYCGYIGGDDYDIGHAIAVDTSGYAYVGGFTMSGEGTFPKTGGPDLTYGGGGDGFVARVYTHGGGLDYCGYIGGSERDEVYGIATDNGLRAFVAGRTESSPANGFPVVGGPDLTHNGWEDAFVAEVMQLGTGLIYCGYIGGSGNDEAHDIALDGDGNAYVVGQVSSDVADGFPVTVGPDLSFGGVWDGFVAKVDALGSAVLYCGYIGGSDADYARSVAVDGAGNAYVAGYTESSEAEGFPVISGPDLTYNGGDDAFVVKVNAGGATLGYSGYIGGTDEDKAWDVAVTSSGNAYVTGHTFSREGDAFPVRGGPDVTHNGGREAFVAKVKVNRPPALDAVIPCSGGEARLVTVYFTTTWTDPDGWRDLKQCYFHIGANTSLAGNVTLMYNAQKHKLWLLDDAGKVWTGGIAPGTPFAFLENSQALVSAQFTKWHTSGDTVRIKWAISFKKTYSGPKKTGLKCKDIYKAKAKGKWKGTWTIY